MTGEPLTVPKGLHSGVVTLELNPEFEQLECEEPGFIRAGGVTASCVMKSDDEVVGYVRVAGSIPGSAKRWLKGHLLPGANVTDPTLWLNAESWTPEYMEQIRTFMAERQIADLDDKT